MQITHSNPQAGSRSYSPRTGQVFQGLLAALLIWAAFISTLSAEPVSKEYQLKAAFIYNFAKFVVWPPENFPGPESPIVIGVVGKNPFGDELENAVRGRKINGRAIVVRGVQGRGDARGAHLLFISAEEEGRLNDFKDATGEHLLTVGESESFTKQGGIIGFTLDGDKLRFEINMAAANQSGLKISAQLQKLASVIRRK